MLFVVALNDEGREHNRLEDLVRILRLDSRVRILEGLGRKAMTVEMPETAQLELQQRLPFATVLPKRKLKLLVG
jgi:hypothetical protein